MMVLDGKQHRYSGTVPLTMAPWVLGLFRNQSALIRWARLPQCSSERSR